MRDIHTMSSEECRAALATWDEAVKTHRALVAEEYSTESKLIYEDARSNWFHLCSEFDLGWDSPAMVAIR